MEIGQSLDKRLEHKLYKDLETGIENNSHSIIRMHAIEKIPRYEGTVYALSVLRHSARFKKEILKCK